MIDYIEWSKQYESEADKLSRKIDKLTQKLKTKLSATERLQIRSRLKRLRYLYRGHCMTVINLRNKGENNA